MTTAELRKIVKAADARARVSQVEPGHWTVRTEDDAAVERLLRSRGLKLEAIDSEGSRWQWVTVLSVFEDPPAHATQRGTMKRFYGTIEYLGKREAIIVLTDAKGAWFGSVKISLPRAKHGKQALYEQGYTEASRKAATHGGELETFREVSK